MPQADPAKGIKDAIAAAWAADEQREDWSATLYVDPDFEPTAGSPVLLVADDGGAAVTGGPWLARRDMLRITIRLTAFAAGRTEARAVVDAAVDLITTTKPSGIARIENVPAVLETRDRETGAYLASITVPVTVRPV